jgi:hypothetical protein
MQDAPGGPEGNYGGIGAGRKAIGTQHVSPPVSRGTPGVFYTYFYNHARRLRLGKPLYLELSRSCSGFFKPLLDPGGGFNSETAERRTAFLEVKRPLHGRFGSETAKTLTAIYSTEIPQRTKVSVRVV